MNLRPEGVKVIVKVDTEEEISKGGLYIPDVARDARQIAATRGEIVAIGPEAHLRFSMGDGVDAFEAKPGHRVIFARYGGSSIRIKGEDYRILYDKDVICLIDGDEEEEMHTPRSPMVKKDSPPKPKEALRQVLRPTRVQ